MSAPISPPPVTPTNPTLPVRAALIAVFIFLPFLSPFAAFPSRRRLPLVDRPFNPPAFGTLLDRLFSVGWALLVEWSAAWVPCLFPPNFGDKPMCWYPRAGAGRFADALAALALAYAISAALAAVIAMPAWTGAVWHKVRGDPLVDQGAERDETDEQDQKVEHLAPVEAIRDGGEEETSQTGGGQVIRRGGGGKDGRDTNSEVLPTSDHHETTYPDMNAANDKRVLAVTFVRSAVLAYVVAYLVRRAPLVWRVRGTVATRTLSLMVWEMAVIWQAAIVLMAPRNHRKVVEAAAMGAASCVRLLLLLRLFATALLGST